MAYRDAFGEAHGRFDHPIVAQESRMVQLSLANWYKEMF